MIPTVIGLTLVAACLHAGWNILLKTSGDPLYATARAAGFSALVATPLVGVAWLVSGRPGFPPHAWALAGLSGLVEFLYLVFLSEAYRRGELSVVYPLARGTAPLLAVLAGLVFLQERISAVQLVGVVCLLAGIWAVRRPVAGGSAVLPAVLTGVCIATYSVIDRVGVQLAPPWLYGWALWCVAAILVTSWVQWSPFTPPAHSERPDTPNFPPWTRHAAVGTLMLLAYLLVLIALRLAPLVLVSPLRESAIVLVTGWGIWRLEEQRGAWLRLLGAGGIVAGLVLVALHP